MVTIAQMGWVLLGHVIGTILFVYISRKDKRKVELLLAANFSVMFILLWLMFVAWRNTS